MGFLGKLAFWKRREEPDFGLGKEPLGLGGDLGLSGADMGFPDAGGFGAQTMPNMPAQPTMQQPLQQQTAPYGFQQAPPSYGYQQPAAMQQSPREYTVAKDIEVISYKLDALRAALESINQRLASLERIARGEEEQPRRRSW